MVDDKCLLQFLSIVDCAIRIIILIHLKLMIAEMVGCNKV